MSKITLSYVITTYNKLPYLREVVRLLLQNVQEDEEVIVADGGSTDGTKEYLQQLFEENKIKKFFSDKDKGEAHGFNKCLLEAKGDLIKIITDDDVFNYVAIRKMKDYMLNNPLIDAATGNILSVNIMQADTHIEYRESYKIWFEQWCNREIKSVFFSCLPLMLRKSSLSLLGLFDTSYKHVDLEYSVRLTALNRSIVFYTDIIAIGLVNEQSISAQAENYTFVRQYALQRLRGNYGYILNEGLKKKMKTHWLRKLFFHKNILLWKFADYFNLFNSNDEFYPNYNRSIELCSIPNSNTSELFDFFEKYLFRCADIPDFRYPVFLKRQNFG